MKTLDEREVAGEAIRVLVEHMDPARVALFLSTWKGGSGDYTALREELFRDMTIDQLVDELKQWRAERDRGSHKCADAKSQ